ncbi:MAG TPA: hypothetical protein PKC28_15685, partial [Bdellovibrionales bacterium]|nr:hypothetical protein [Bdellovibrionales bacterium]
MARVLVFVDRAPGDPEWKGAFAWDLIRGLAESQHQVLALTILDPSEVDISHPRLTIARPAPSWNVMFAPRFLRAVIGFRPEIVHSIGLRSARGFAPLTVWPILNSACVALPGMRRFSTFFDEKDLLEGDPASGWHRGSRRATAFTVRARESLRERLGFDL